MMKYMPLIVLAALAASPLRAQDVAVPPAQTTPAAITTGKMLYAAGGARLAAVNRKGPNGAAGIIYEGRMIFVPASTISLVDGKMTTSLKKSEIGAIR